MSDADRARLTIDLYALAHNYAVLGAEAAGAAVAPVVKADGYGLGAVPVARRLRAGGARSFFVARLGRGGGPGGAGARLRPRRTDRGRRPAPRRRRAHAGPLQPAAAQRGPGLR